MNEELRKIERDITSINLIVNCEFIIPHKKIKRIKELVEAVSKNVEKLKQEVK